MTGSLQGYAKVRGRQVWLAITYRLLTSATNLQRSSPVNACSVYENQVCEVVPAPQPVEKALLKLVLLPYRTVTSAIGHLSLDRKELPISDTVNGV